MFRIRWIDLKKQRAERLGWRCEVCKAEGDRRTIVGHHINGRKQQATSSDEVELRCPVCEGIAHELDQHGNPGRQAILQERRLRDGSVGRRKRLYSCADTKARDKPHPAHLRQVHEGVLPPPPKKGKADSVRVRVGHAT